MKEGSPCKVISFVGCEPKERQEVAAGGFVEWATSFCADVDGNVQRR
jgi:hypothetical protein